MAYHFAVWEFTPSESNWWHNRPAAKLHRAQVKRHLRKLLGDAI